jgi:hypothetical protein
LGQSNHNLTHTPLGVDLPDHYRFSMSTFFAPVPIAIACLLTLIALAGFGGWFAQSGAMFMAAVQTGLSWCL